MIAAARTISLVVATLMLPGAAFASSDAEWAKFAKDVEQKCTEATAETFRKSQVVVDPTGSENFGLAIVYGRSKQAKGPAAVICVYDKKTMKVEVGGEMGKDLIRVRKPKPDGQDDKNADAKQKQSGAQTGNTGNADDDDQQ
jgi:hypothetical protein